MAVSSLDAALSGLRIAQQQLDVIANNVANVGTPGFTRKILPQGTLVLNGQSAGVLADNIIRKVNLDVERNLWTQISKISFLDIQAGYLNQIQQFHGPPDLEVSVAAELAELRDKFAALADSPEDHFLQRSTVDQASLVARKINDLSNLFTQIRNDAQDEMAVAIQRVNSTLEQIADLNKQIKLTKIGGRTTAALEDQRDTAIKNLAEEIEVSFFTRADGVLVVQTSQGVQLADERAETVFFDPTLLGPTSFYPSGARGIFVGGDPASNPTAIEITGVDLNGRIGALIDVRDNLMPQQQAMIDELAHKLALRFEAQGLRLFTDASGTIPADTPPNPSIPTPVTYVGFSSIIRINDAILADNSIIQRGTTATDLPVQTGSNEVIQRIVEFTFGDTNYQEAAGAVDLRASGGPDTLQNWLGVFSQNQITGTADIANYSDIAALIAAGGTVFDPNPPGPPLNDSFTITFEEARTAPPLGPTAVTVSLSSADANFPIGGAITNALDQLVAEINLQIGLAGVPAGLAAQASVSPYGQLIIESRGDITIDSSFPGGMFPDGLEFLGLVEGTSITTDPYIDVQVGNDPPVRIAIEPGDDETTLAAKLDKISAADPGVPGLAVEIDPLTGFLTLRPGDSMTNPAFGGDLKILGGPFVTDGTGTGPGALATGRTLVAALFGSDAPVASLPYASLTANPAVSVPFRVSNLGPGANIDTGVISSSNLIDYAQKMVNRQTEGVIANESQRADEASFRDLLQRRFLDESGVNLDEELSHMITVQTAYAAAARVISSVDEQFRELLRAV